MPPSALPAPQVQMRTASARFGAQIGTGTPCAGCTQPGGQGRSGCDQAAANPAIWRDSPGVSGNSVA